MATDHLDSPDFPPHARFHAALGGIYLVALSILLLTLAWGPVRGGRSGYALAFGFCMISIPTGALVSVVIVPSGAPPQGTSSWRALLLPLL